MKIGLWSVGKAHDTYVKEGIEDFTHRISKYYPVDWRIILPARQTVNTTEQEIKKQEAQVILSYLRKDDFLVLLDENGKQLTSPQLATFIERNASNSVKHIVFLVGGAFGVNDLIKNRANYTWSLSALVFPHQLVRLMLVEQIYRACSIIRNEKYHHD